MLICCIRMEQIMANELFPLLEKAPFNRLGANQYGPSIKRITKGSLVSFNYALWKHDPNPLIIITDIFGDYIRGVNLHYLTLPYIKRILSSHCDNMMFSYFIIKQDTYIANAFRTYKRIGIRLIRKLDCNFLVSVLSAARTMNPAEVIAMRKFVQDQLRRQVNPKAQATGEKYMGMLQPKQEFVQTGGTPTEREFPKI